MQFLVLFAAALAVASAGYVAPFAYAGHGIHLPTIDASGVPVDTAEVQHAKAAHATHYAVAASRAGEYEYAPYVAHHAYAAPVIAHGGLVAHAPVVAHGHHAYPTSAVHPAVTADGIPLNTPEVAAATAHHVAAHHEALGRIAHHYVKRSVAAYAAPIAYAAYGAQHLPTIDASGVPVDTAEVQHAKAAHATHYSVAASRAGEYEYAPYVAHAYAAAPVIAHHAGLVAHAPVLAHGHHAYPTSAVHPAIAADGTPLDTPEVAHAKADHYAAYNAEAARNSVHPYAVHGYAAPYAYAAPWAVAAPAHYVPADTPEVAHAKAEHFAAHAAVRAHL